MNEALLIFGMFLVTFGVRYPVLAFVSRIQLPELMMRSLKYVPPAVLSAIITPAVLIPDGVNPDLSLSNPGITAAIAAALVSYRTKNLLATILIGMAVFFGMRWVIG